MLLNIGEFFRLVMWELFINYLVMIDLNPQYDRIQVVKIMRKDWSKSTIFPHKYYCPNAHTSERCIPAPMTKLDQITAMASRWCDSPPKTKYQPNASNEFDIMRGGLSGPTLLSCQCSLD